MAPKELDGLPLMPATAGAYLDQVAISLSDYVPSHTRLHGRNTQR
jgi:hypothetical protein